MTKAILLIWIGIAQSQTMSMTKFDSLEECRAARAAIVENYKGEWSARPIKKARCIQYKISN